VYGGYVLQGFVMLEMIVHFFEAEHWNGLENFVVSLCSERSQVQTLQKKKKDYMCMSESLSRHYTNHNTDTCHIKM
jgi:hypothetical protein